MAEPDVKQYSLIVKRLPIPNLPIAGGLAGHLFFEIVDFNNLLRNQIHGLAIDLNTREEVAVGSSNNNIEYRNFDFLHSWNTEGFASQTIFTGTLQQMKDLVNNFDAVGKLINDDNFKYEAIPAGTYTNAQGQSVPYYNSNAVFNTLLHIASITVGLSDATIESAKSMGITNPGEELNIMKSLNGKDLNLKINGESKHYYIASSDAGVILEHYQASCSLDDIIVMKSENISLIRQGAEAVINGGNYLISDLVDSAIKGAEALATFINKEVTAAVDWFSHAGSNVQVDIGYWLANNLDGLVHGRMSADEAFIDLAKYIGRQELSNELLRQLDGVQTVDAAKNYIFGNVMDAKKFSSKFLNNFANDNYLIIKKAG